MSDFAERILHYALGAMIGVFGFLLRYIWTRHEKDIASAAEMAKKAVPLEVYEQNRMEMRENVMEIHKKIDSSVVTLNDKINDSAVRMGDKIDKNETTASGRHDTLMNVLLNLKNQRERS